MDHRIPRDSGSRPTPGAATMPQGDTMDVPVMVTSEAPPVAMCAAAKVNGPGWVYVNVLTGLALAKTPGWRVHFYVHRTGREDLTTIQREREEIERSTHVTERGNGGETATQPQEVPGG